MSGGGGVGGRVAVGAACALLAVCLAGGPLYVSSAASESVQLQLASTCLSDVALHLPRADDPSHLQLLDEIRADVRHAEEPVVGIRTHTEFVIEGDPTATVRSATIAWRDGQAAHLVPSPALAPGEVVVPEYLVEALDLTVGESYLSFEQEQLFEFDENGNLVPIPPGPDRRVRVVGTYEPIPIRPEPSFWCGLRDELRPNSQGDPPPPLVLADRETARINPHFPPEWELRPDADNMTRDDAREYQADIDAAVVRYTDHYAIDAGIFRQQTRGLTSVGAIADRAETVADVVGRTMAPVRVAGVAAASLVLAASGVMVARERRRELRLRAVRGVSPWASMLVLLRGLTLPALTGAVVGAALAFGAVIAVGPTPELETGPTRTAIVSALVGGVIAAVAVSALAAFAGDRAVDRPPSHRWWRRVPIELAVPVLAVLAYRRFDEVGGVRLVGDEARGGDLLAQSFPLLAVATPLAIVGRPLRWLARRLRTAGGGLPAPVRLGLRRALAEPATTALIVVSSALAAGCIVLSSSLTASAERQLVDKATTFIGSDQAVRLASPIDLPAELLDRATIVGRANGKADGKAVSILAVDRSTFARAVRSRDDTALAGLLDRLAVPVDGRTPVIAVGDVPREFALTDRRNSAPLDVTVIDAPSHFPGYRNGPPLVVIDLDVVETSDIGPPSWHVWVRDPPPDTVQLLRDAGARVTAEGQVIADVFDVTSFRAVRWSYSALGAFGVLVTVVVLMMQVLVIDARRGTRQAAHIVMSRAGFRRRRLAYATTIEVGLPLVLGVLLGTALGIVTARISVERLDTLRQLPPPAVTVYEGGMFVLVAAATAVAVVVLALLGVVSAVRARPMEVMRGTA